MLINEIWGSLQRVGIFSTMFLALSRLFDWSFDMRHSLQTSRRHQLSELEGLDESGAERGQMYQPTGVLPFRKICKKVGVIEDSVFLDFGSGKGRTLVLAAESGAKVSIGVEFSPELCEVAESNLETYKANTSVNCEFELVCADAREYKYRGDETVFYLFYPFDATVMKAVLENLEKELKRNRREAFVIYYYPQERAILDSSEIFEVHWQGKIYGYDCVIYKSS